MFWWKAQGHRQALLSTVSLAALLAAGEPEALALSFEDATFAEKTGFYGSAFIKDLSTPANDYDNSPDTSAASLLTYNAPSPKMLMQADGVMKLCAHNKVLYSEDFSNVAWVKQFMLGFGSGSVSAVETYRGISYDKLVPSTSTADPHYARQDVTSVGPARVEVRAKANGYSKIVLYMDGPTEGVGFDLSAGTEHATSLLNPPADSGIEALGDGHYLCWAVSSTSITRARLLIVTDFDDYIFAGDETSGVNVGGFAIRHNPAVNTYLKTTDTPRYALPICFEDGLPVGLRPESQRTNIFLNSETGATQDCSVSATDYTLSFWGTGTITLSGASSAGPLVGTGISDRVSLTFTPSAGTLTLTVGGTCSRVQLEAGSSASSYIPTYGSTVTRARDDFTLNTSRFRFSATEGSFYGVYVRRQDAVAQQVVALDAGNNSNTIFMVASDTSAARAQINTGGVTQANQGAAHAAINTTAKQSMSWASNSVRGALNGTGFTEDTSATLPTVDRIRLGNRASGGNALDGDLVAILYVPRQKSQTELDGETT